MKVEEWLENYYKDILKNVGIELIWYLHYILTQQHVHLRYEFVLGFLHMT